MSVFTAHEKRGYNRAINDIIAALVKDLRNQDMPIAEDTREYIKELLSDLREWQT